MAFNNAGEQRSAQAQHQRSSSPTSSSSHERPISPSSQSFYVQALYAYSGVDTSSLSFRQGDIIEVLSTLASGWWDGVICDQKIRGWFPSNYVQRISEEEAAWAREQMMGWWEGDDAGRRGSIMSARGGEGKDDFTGGVDFMSAEDLTSFSNGGDIFSEIAAAAQADSSFASSATATSSANRNSLYAAPSSSARRSMEPDADEEDYWVPKVSNSGQLFYFNTRTGETSRDMPIDGQGDGVRIDPREFAQDDEDLTLKRRSVIGGKQSSILDWTKKMTTDGTGVYYENLRTGERSWDPPVGRGGASSSPVRGRNSVSEASLLSAWTERPSAGGDDTASMGKADTLRRMSVYSDDSALDVDFGRESAARREGKGKEVARKDENESPRDKRKAKHKTRKGSSTAQLLDPLPPPLVSELEVLVTVALQELINAAGIGGMVRRSGSHSNPVEERERLAVLGDGVVNAIRTLLHASGVLEQPLASSTFASHSPINEIVGAFSRAPAVPPTIQAELRPYTRRVTSTLSKLVLSVRAVWGILETAAGDQVLDEDDGLGDAEDQARREQAREQILAEWARMRETRFETEAKLRSEVLAGARDVQSNVLAFLNEFERLVGDETAANGEPVLPRALLRAPKALQGSLRTNAAALLLPGGGFGGNWRGNGFVTLPTPNSTPNLPSSIPDAPPLSYAYPSQSISPEVAVALLQSSKTLLAEAEALRDVVNSITITTTPTDEDEATTPGLAQKLIRLGDSNLSPTQLLDQAAQLQRQLATFLTKVEDIDVASGVDFELPTESQSRPSSRRDVVSTSGSISSITNTTQSSDQESILDPAAASEYRASVLEARPLLAELEVRKQALYDVAPRLLAALQELYMASSQVSASPIGGPQPLSTSPLAFFSAPSLAEAAPDVVFEILSDLNTGVTSLCTTVTSLGAIAEVQSSAPSNLRRPNLAFRNSLFDTQTASTRSSVVPDTMAASFSSSRVSLSREDDPAEASSHSRESVDSDFFFSGSTVPSVRTKTSSKQLFSPTTPGWEKRRGSVATNNTSVSSQVDVQSTNSINRMSPSKSVSNTKLAKLLGTDPHDTSPSPSRKSTNSEPTPPWLGPDYGPDEVSFNMEGQVKGGTLRALVIAAASHEGRVDSNYLSAFLMTYRTFCTSHDLLDLLIERFLIEAPEGLTVEEMKEWETRKLRPIRARVANVLKSWVREYMDHDQLDPELLRRIADFASNTMRDPVQSPQIIKVVEERLSGVAPRQVGNLAPGPLPPSFVPRNFRKLKFMDIDPLELARQLTIMDGRLFARITPQECLGKAWPKQYGSEAPNISAMIDMSNAVTRWVTETILQQDDLKKRANIVKQFILVAERCLALNNYSTLIHIIAGLNSTPIHRLRRTWETVNQKSMISLGMLNNIMRPDKNYKEYRDQLRKVAPPCVPFLGVYLTDWTFIGDGNPDMLREKPHQINFNKRQKASELILMIKLHQATTYNLAAVPVLAKFIDESLFPPNSNPATDDQRLYEMSLMREPRERDDEKIARLLSESGFL
ncbi:hypothetical protein BCR35DRAFT_330390 [Leucosporidium creatinivorum]|uniref:Ras guanine nucleotide exchange factor domain-containing protein n=1 Tax=Leucosporidium creatinivorum TaxID=106004 RepID=A0A1Y2FVQ9_9BASI|nr:hypothetical protein BCR35DRAFT_330390 [Leucosporidium creatinivorum]